MIYVHINREHHEIITSVQNDLGEMSFPGTVPHDGFRFLEQGHNGIVIYSFVLVLSSGSQPSLSSDPL